MKNAGFKILLAVILLALAGFFVKSSLDYVSPEKGSDAQRAPKREQVGRSMDGSKQKRPAQGSASGTVELAQGAGGAADAGIEDTAIQNQLIGNLGYLTSLHRANLRWIGSDPIIGDYLEKLKGYSQVYRQKLFQKNRSQSGEYNKLAAALRDNIDALEKAYKDDDREAFQNLYLDHIQICMDCHATFKDDEIKEQEAE